MSSTGCLVYKFTRPLLDG